MSEAAVVGLLVRYVAGIITASELARRLPDGWELDQQDDPELRRLVLRTMGYLAGYQNGVHGEFDLKQALRSLILSWGVTAGIQGSAEQDVGGPNRYFALQT
jgi:hypothetical protein